MNKLQIKMPNNFQRVGLTAPTYNWFEMNHPVLTSFDIGRLVPKAFNVYAGDRVKIGMEHLIRFQQMYAPVFQRFDVRFDVGYYPFRLVWKDALNFFRGGNSGNTEYPFPSMHAGYIYAAIAYIYLTENNLAETDSLQGNPFLHSLIDYFSMPTFDVMYAKCIDENKTYADFLDAVMVKFMSEDPVNILPFVMYQGFFRQWYRNKQVDVNNNEDEDWQFGNNHYWQNLQNWTSYVPEIDVYDLMQVIGVNSFMSSAPATYQLALSRLQNTGAGWIDWIRTLFGVQDVRYSNDYFTSSLPSPLMPEVQIPMGNVGVYAADGSFITDKFGSTSSSSGNGNNLTHGGSSAAVNANGAYARSLRVDAGTIQQLRQASAMDQYQIRSALGGNGTSQDWILAHYGVKTSDMRLDMPQIINRVKSFVSISEVTQTSSSTDDSALGEFGGHGISINNHGLCDFFVEEPGMMFIFMSVVPKQAYFQGMPKLFTRTDRFDFPIPEFAQVGMEPVYRKELFFDGDPDDQSIGQGILGYQDRYAFDKTMLPEIHGDFRTTLSSWHDTRIFDSQPALNSDFIKVDHLQGLDRIFNVTDAKENKLLALLNYHVSIERALPVYPRYSL